jgi:CRP-like cAMP-binding protein
VLCKPESERLEDEIKLLFSIIKIFFKDKGDLEIYEIARHIKYEFHKEGDVVFDYGSVGDKFYLIIRGEVAVLIPSQKQPQAI